MVNLPSLNTTTDHQDQPIHLDILKVTCRGYKRYKYMKKKLTI